MTNQDLNRLWVLADALVSDPDNYTGYLDRLSKSNETLKSSLDKVKTTFDEYYLPSDRLKTVAVVLLINDDETARLFGEMFNTVLGRRMGATP